VVAVGSERRRPSGDWCSTFITPVLRQLHWLPVRQSVDFKVATLVHRSLSGISPTTAVLSPMLMSNDYVPERAEYALRRGRAALSAIEYLQLLDQEYGIVLHRT